MEKLENSKPVLKKYMVKDDQHRIDQIKKKRQEIDTQEYEPIDELEVYESIRNIKDPEHPYTLEELRVVELEKIKVDDQSNLVEIEYTPTIPHCSLATLIGLTIKVKLIRTLPPRMKVRVRVCKNTHNNEHDINKQLNDKERVAAAIENKHLLNLVNQGVYNSHNIDQIFSEFA